MTNRDKDASVDYILNHGLVKPQTVYQRVREMIFMLGFRFIFWDTVCSLCFAALTLAGMLVLPFITPVEHSHSTAVALSPLLFLLITFFTETTERVSGLYELKQTCRYTIRQITALRVMCYSAVSVVFTASVAAIMASTAVEFFTLLPLCLSMLFLCAFIQLSVLRLINSKWVFAAVLVLWVFFSIALPLGTDGRWEALLRRCPAVIGVAVMLLSAIAFSAQLRKMFMEVDHYAIA